MTRQDLAIVLIRCFGLVFGVLYGIGVVVQALHVLETNYFYPWSHEVAYRTSYTCAQLAGQLLGVGAAIVLLRRGKAIAKWLVKDSITNTEQQDNNDGKI